VPITINLPTGDYVGPGLPIQVVSDFIGPLPSGSFFRFIVARDVELTEIIWRKEVPTIGNGTLTVPYDDWPLIGDFPPAESAIGPTSLTLDVGLVQGGSNTVVDSGTTSVHWDATTGLPRIITSLTAASAQVLSPTQSQELADVHASTTMQLGADAGSWLGNLAGLISRPPLLLLKVGPSIGVFSGDGVLPAPAHLSGLDFGLYWVFVRLPPGIGLKGGAIVEYQWRVLQLAVEHTLASGPVISEYVDHNADRFLWFWTNPLPSHVYFSILPGVEVEFHYVQLITT
jgi:hypothetical protein